ncbi:MAG: phosphatase PAP2 family protein [Myxococcota bacterium]
MTSPIFLLAGSIVLAQGESPYDVNWEVDAMIAGGTLGFALLAGQINDDLPSGLQCRESLGTRCDPQVLNALDRTVVGNASATWSTISDVGKNGALALAFAANGLDVARSNSDRRWNDFGRDSLVIGQAVGVNALLTVAAKAAFRRSRPTHYVEGSDLSRVQERFSFPSGHASVTASAATAYATTFALRHPDSRWRFAVIGGAAAWSATTAYARVAAGRHFYTDVLAGLLLGTTVGFVVPKLHERDADRDRDTGASARTPMLQLGGVF